MFCFSYLKVMLFNYHLVFVVSYVTLSYCYHFSFIVIFGSEVQKQGPLGLFPFSQKCRGPSKPGPDHMHVGFSFPRCMASPSEHHPGLQSLPFFCTWLFLTQAAPSRQAYRPQLPATCLLSFSIPMHEQHAWPTRKWHHQATEPTHKRKTHPLATGHLPRPLLFQREIERYLKLSFGLSFFIFSSFL